MINFVLTTHRDKKIAKRFLKKAIRCHGLPEKITVDKSGASCSIRWPLKNTSTTTGQLIRFENSRQSQKSYIKPVLSIASSQATIELQQKRFV
jgi:transposase-like protein